MFDRSTKPERGDERGAVLVIAGFAVIALLATAAIVVDLSAARNDRSTNQVSSDAAATAGAIALSGGTGVDGCETALSYLELHVRQALVGASCGGFPLVCDASTPSASTTGTVDGITATITYPVYDADLLMTPETIGSPTSAITDQDGDPCARVGVALSEDRDLFFGGFVGMGSQTTSAHSVALGSNIGENSKAINLLILHRTDCDSISANGGGTGGGIAVKGVTNPATGEVQPGLLAADSDGTTNCSSDGVINVVGSGAVVRADGEPGCDGELPSGPGDGCGTVDVFAESGPGCAVPACLSSGTVAPDPSHPRARLTRAQIDWRFNCKVAYPASYDIEGCRDATTTSPYIDGLVADVGISGPPTGFQSYQDEGYQCGNISSSDTVTVPEGNWWVECDLKIKGKVLFEGGNIIFDKSVQLFASGELRVNMNNFRNYHSFGGFDHNEHSAGAAWLFFRDGTFSKTAQASIFLQNTMVYLSETSNYEMSGGSGATWIVAPTEGPFENLALWSESTAEVKFGGSSVLELEGVFFVPYATVNINGGGSQQQVAAQFIASKLSVGGGGLIEIAPIYDRMVRFPVPVTSELIR